MVRSFTLLTLAAIAAVMTAPARGQDAAHFPSHPITLVVVYAPGGPPDIVARLLAPKLGDILGQPVIVENKPGAGGAIGDAFAAHATPDGHTLLMVDLGFVTNPLVVAKPGYDPRRDFAYVAPLTRAYMTMFVNQSFPAKTIGEFIARAKAKPGELKYGSAGIGSSPYLGALAFVETTGINMIHVPYRGVTLAINDLISGEISAVWASFASAAGQVKGGLLRALGIYGDQRLASIPDTPTFQESGVNAGVVDQGNWQGIVAPAGTPADIVVKLNGAINETLRDPQVHAGLVATDFVKTDGGTPEELKSLVDDSLTYWSALFNKAGVKPE